MGARVWQPYWVGSLNHVFRVTTFLENLEMSGNFAVVREMSGKTVVFKEQTVHSLLLLAEL